jgi:hypothetical protein
VDPTNSIIVDSETWGALELFEVIVSRYFELGREGPLPPSWEVRGKEGTEVSRQLILLNKHLEPMGMVGALEESNPPVLSISRLPTGQVVLKKWQLAMVWLAMTALMTMIGLEWVAQYGRGSSPIGFGAIGQSILYFTTPIVLVILTASQLKRAVARKFGVEIGNMVPIAFPISSLWPFGIVGVMGQRRGDLVPVPDRKSLGIIEMTPPLALVILGSALTIFGLGMTPESPPELEGSPVLFDTNLLVSMFSGSWLGDGMGLRLQWLHPTGIAGIGLSIVGWGLMLPIPGLPGDRAMHAIMGPSQMREGGFQTSIFVAVLGVLVIIFATSDYSPWVFLAAIGVWQRFYPESIPQPIVLNEFMGLEDRERSRLTAIAMIILIAGFPGALPSYQLVDYDVGLSTESWPEELEIEDENEMVFSLKLEPDGLMPVSGWLQVQIEGNADGWEMDSDCFDLRGLCRFAGITQSSTGVVWINLSRDEAGRSLHSFRLVILVDVQGHEEEHSIVFRQGGATIAFDPMWKVVEDSGTPLICTELLVVEGDELVVSLTSNNSTSYNPFWYFENDTVFDPGFHELCMRGHEGAWASLFQTWESLGGRRKATLLAPEIFLTRENGTDDRLIMPIDKESRLQFSNGDWEIKNLGGYEEYSISFGESGSAFCPSSEVMPVANSSGEWDFELSDRSAISVLANYSGNGALELGEGWLAFCTDSTITQFDLYEGPEVWVEGINDNFISETSGNNYSSLFAKEMEITFRNRENYTMPISLEWSGQAAEWENFDVVVPSEVGAKQNVTARLSINGTAPDAWVVWHNVDASGVTLHIAARTVW